MTKNTPSVQHVLELTTSAQKLGISQVVTQDNRIEEREITVHDRSVINFASCSYLGLEQDPRLVLGTIDAVRNYGTQFSSSRAYLSVTLYDELENLLGQLFGNPTIVSSTTTLGHHATIPSVVSRNDLIILDQQVHASVQGAAKVAVANGTAIETVRHNRLDYLENRVKKLQDKYEKIWYMADGVYSMYGDFCPMDELYALADKYECLHLYIDDAHGMSWMGKNGIGYALNERDMHPKMIMLTSLNKSFAAAGGAIITPTEELKQLIKSTGGSLMFSGPVQPPMLGAAVASAKIHLSDEITEMQKELREKMDYFHQLILANDLPLLGGGDTPIFYIGIGKTMNGYHAVQRLMQRGYFTSIGGYPSVPINRTGVRVTINRTHTYEQIADMTKALTEVVHEILREENMTMEDLYKGLKLPYPQAVRA